MDDGERVTMGRREEFASEIVAVREARGEVSIMILQGGVKFTFLI